MYINKGCPKCRTEKSNTTYIKFNLKFKLNYCPNKNGIMCKHKPAHKRPFYQKVARSDFLHAQCARRSDPLGLTTPVSSAPPTAGSGLSPDLGRGALDYGKMSTPSLPPSQEPSTTDQVKLGYKYPSSLALQWDNPGACVLYHFPGFPHGIKLQSPTVLDMHSFLAAFPSLSHFPFPHSVACTSHISCVHWDPQGVLHII